MPDSTADRRSAGITIRDLDKHYGALKVLDRLSLDVPPGSFVALLGPSGCGKTTLLRIIAGLERADRGSITIGDRCVLDVGAGLVVPPQKRRLGMVFQHYALWPHMTIRENICYPLRKQGIARAEWEMRIRAIADLVGLPTILDRRPSQLSGGQQQRVALARALVAEPNVLLLDEPLSNLDANLRDQLRRELRQLHDRHGKTTILVTHDQEEATMLADVIVVINRGRIVQIGHPDDIVERPTDRFVAAFVGYDNFLHGVIDASDDAEVSVRLGGGAVLRLCGRGRRFQAGHAATIGVRSTGISLNTGNVIAAGPSIPIQARVTKVQSLGRYREIFMDCAGIAMTARDVASAVGEIRVGDELIAHIPATSPIFVDDAM